MAGKVLVIAEAGVNHNGSMDTACELIDMAADAGADIVKFQSFSADRLASKDAPKADYQVENTGAEETQYEMLKRLELSENDHKVLMSHCRQRGIEFLSTAFDIEGLHMLVDGFGLPLVKLGSSELTNAPLLLAAARTGRDIIFSTGMGTLEEIRTALGVLAFGYSNSSEKPSPDIFRKAFEDRDVVSVLREKVTILHCSTAYPTPYEDVNLKAMQTIGEEFSVNVGYSDHTMGIEIPVAAVAMGACVIEKHFTLDRAMPGPDHKASLEPDELKAMVRSIRNVEKALGDGQKVLGEAEKANMFMARKSLFAACDIEKGEVFTDRNVTVKRPAAGRPPIDYWDVIGTKAEKTYSKDEPLQP